MVLEAFRGGRKVAIGGEPLPAGAGKVTAVIAPNAGYPFSGATAGKSFRIP